MNIGGLQKLTLLDYPGKIACTVFTVGCNLRCPFCHNASLVTHPQDAGYVTDDELFSFLKKRKGVLDGVCVTGGEPTLQKDLPDFLEKLKDLGYLVKLDTNGTNPRILRSVIDGHLVDYVAMDIKNSPEKYILTSGGIDLLKSIEESVSALLSGKVQYEFRTTVANGFHETEDFESIGKWISGANKYFIQNFVDSGDLISQGTLGIPKEKMYEFLKTIQKYIPSAELRGI
ncbi:MAG: anaerobic ribonucleoside-triphosphate reductase activating protein [Ruminococcaceae bacterium]|nr:anaerobic ribonucleoside-triphosphate reductase activating protein [Oscillospiraceae bacterium]